jgi:hypothetical protein
MGHEDAFRGDGRTASLGFESGARLLMIDERTFEADF